MDKYMIHTCLARQWYVEEHLIPSMIAQGIPRENIIIFLDSVGRGNLLAFLDSLDWISKNEPQHSGIWHLQDDVIISSDFKDVTESHTGLVQGFCSDLDDNDDYWFSFQCIRIPNFIAIDFKQWALDNKERYKDLFKANKYDDSLFRYYLIEKVIVTTKLYPNIVEHVDYLLGGSVVNIDRKTAIRSKYFRDEHLVKALARKLNK